MIFAREAGPEFFLQCRFSNFFYGNTFFCAFLAHFPHFLRIFAFFSRPRSASPPLLLVCLSFCIFRFIAVHHCCFACHAWIVDRAVRLDDPQEWVEAGLRDVFVQAGLKLVEWPDKAGAQRPVADLALHIQCDEAGQRQVRAEALGARGRAMLEAL